jgi:hypothetical protein
MTVEMHRRSVVVWDVPPAIERGSAFRVRIGIKCALACPSERWTLDVRDHDGNVRATATVGNEIWPGTAALYFSEIELRAPDAEGLYEWVARAPQCASGDNAHAQASAGFNVRTMASPQCLLTVIAVDKESRTPIQGAKVVLHPYRAVTDARGVASIAVAKGRDRLFVSGGQYFPFRVDSEVTADMTLRAELEMDLAPGDAELWP